MKKIQIYILAFMMLASVNVFSQTAVTVIKNMGPGFNLGNVWDNGVKVATYASVKPIIDKYVSEGMTNVRIPTTWMDAVDGNTLADGNGNLITTNSRFTELVNTINYCLSKGLYVTINTHHETWLKNNYNGTTYYDTKFYNLWYNIATYFKSFSSKLVFEILNEPEGKMGVWDGVGGYPDPTGATEIGYTRQIMKVGYNAIRATGGNNTTRLVMVSPNGQANQSQIEEVFPSVAELPGGGADQYLGMHVHSYDPWGFCGHTGWNYNNPGTATFIAGITTCYNHAQTKLGGIPVHYGEFGVGRAPEKGGGPETERADAVVLAYYKTFAETAISKNMAFSVWDDRGWFSLINDAGSAFTYNIVPTMMTNIKRTIPTTPVLTTIIVTPATSTLTVGQTAQFAAAGKDQFGAAINMTPTWTVTGGGTISASGLFTATTAGGPFTVKANSGTVSGTVSVTVNAPAKVSAIPGKVEAESYAAYNNVEATQMIVATTDGGLKMGYNSVGDWYDYSVNVATAGTYTVDFRVANGSAATGQFQLLSGTTVLAIVDVPVTGSWETFTTISKPVNFTTAGPQTIRIYTVVAGVDYNWINFSQATPILTSITISASPATTTAGTNATFTAQGKDQFGANIAATISWSVSAGATISTAGVFSSTTAGIYTVTASSGIITKTATITVTAAALSTITLTPATATKTAGTTQQYAASGVDAYNNAVAITPTWSVSGGGTISTSGLFTATTVGGPFTVTATSGTISVTSQVTVTVGALSAITLTPATATKTAGTTQQYVASGKDAYNNAISVSPSWTVSGGGTISTSGIFTATTAGGPYTVTATSGTISGTAQVTVTAGAFSIITLSPATATITSGTTQQYTATGKDANNNAITVTPTWTVSGGGTITTSGLFTATTIGGPFTVTATSGSISATAQVTVSAPTGAAIPGTIQAEAFTANNGLIATATTIGYVDPGDWIEYAVNVATAGTYTMTFNVATTLATGSCYVTVDGGASLGTFTCPNTTSWTVFKNYSINVVLPAGAHTLRLNYTAAAFNTDYMVFTKYVPATNTVAFTPPMVVESGDTYTIAVNYSSTTANDVNVGLYTAAWGLVVTQTKSVAAGSGVVNFSITIPAATAVGTTYIWQTQIMPVGGTYLQRYSVVNKPNVQVTNLKSANLGFDESSNTGDVNIYPSPVSNVLHLSGTDNFNKISLYNCAGQIVKSIQKGSESLFNIDVQNLKNGMYFIEFSNETERITKKIIKN
jgi:endoglucanase